MIDETDWMEVVRRQSKAQVPIGKIALKSGMLTIREVQETLRVSAGSKVLFGETAVELGFLDMDQIGALLAIQRHGRPPFSQIYSEMECVDPVVLKRATEEWESSNR